MSDFLQLAILLVIILTFAKIAGYLSTLLHQPAVLGELLVGVLLGPSLINITHLSFITNSQIEEVISEIGQIGVLLLMFLAGLELNFKDLSRNTKLATRSSILGVAFPLGFGFLFGHLLGMSVNESLFIGLSLSATSVSISAQVLLELKAIKSKVGLALLSTAIFDDIIVLLVFSAALVFISGGNSFSEILTVFLKMFLFLGLSAAFGLWVLPPLTRWASRLPVSKNVSTLAIIILLGYGIAAELLGGMAAITGTFIAGLFFARTSEKNLIENDIHSLAYTFFVPIFFVSIGLSVNLLQIRLNTLWIILGISLIAIIGKIIGAGIGAVVTQFSKKESFQLALGMIPRGEVSLIIAKLGLDSGYLSSQTYSAVIAMVLITSIVTPPLLRKALHSSLDQTDQKEKPEIISSGSNQ